jgi:V8-like Glu-specific endopeptidase
MKKIAIAQMCLLFIGCNNTEQLSNTKTVFEESKISLVSTSDISPKKSIAAVGNLLRVFLPTEEDQEKFYIPSCTAIQISDQHILTAKHCVQPEMVYNKDQIALESDLNLIEYRVYGDNIRLNFDGELIEQANNALNQELLKNPIYIDSELDFAIYKLPEKNNSKYINIFKRVSKRQNYDNLTLYGHPNGIPLSKSTNCKGAVAEGYFYHTCDSLSGSSGGLIVDSVSDTPIALHVAGSAFGGGLYYREHGLFQSPEQIAIESGCRADSKDFESCVIVKGRNKAILLTTIAEKIKKNSPELYNILNCRSKNKY